MQPTPDQRQAIEDFVSAFTMGAALEIVNSVQQKPGATAIDQIPAQICRLVAARGHLAQGQTDASEAVFDAATTLAVSAFLVALEVRQEREL